MTKHRIEWIDCVRAIGMVMIITTHTYAPSFIGYFLFAVNVPIFFVLSGYLTKEKPISKVAKGGLRTLLIPYLVTVLVMFLCSLISFNRHVPGFNTTNSWYQYLLAGAYGIGTPTVQSVIPNVQVPSIGAIWFLFAMYIGNIIYQLILKLACNKSKIATTLILLVVGSVLAAIGFEISLRVQLPWSIGAALISVIFYASGHLIKIWKMMDLTVVNTVYALLGLGLWILATIKGPFYMNVGFAAHPLYATLGAIGGSYFIMYLFKLIEQKISLRLLARLGQLALITLSIHIIGLQIFTDASFLTRKLLAYGFSGGLIGVTILLYRICILWILTIILSKSKYIRYVFAIR